MLDPHEQVATGERLCLTCGHAKSDHYTYVLNGHDQQRCKKCDPHTGKRIGAVHAMQAGSEEDRMYHFADHDFVPMLPMK